MQHLIELDHLAKSFGKRVILHDVNLTVNRGEIVGLIGPSGSGKPQLLKQCSEWKKRLLEQPLF